MRMSYSLIPTSVKQRISAALDDFTTFTWNNIDMYQEYGAFIVSKNDLQFYNGPKFSNTYNEPQFDRAAKQLSGISFETQELSLTIGVYGFTIDVYRRLLRLFDAYSVGNLTFSFDKEHFYIVKVSSLKDSTRYVLPTKLNGQYTYYTELDITFEIQGEACAWNVNPFQYRTLKDLNTTVALTNAASDLDVPFVLDLTIPLTSETISTENSSTGNPDKDLKDDPAELPADGVLYNKPGRMHIITQAVYNDGTKDAQIFELFAADFVNLSFNDEEEPNKIHIRYISDSASVLYKLTQDEYRLLTLTEINSNNGGYITEGLTSFRFAFPGNFSTAGFEYDPTNWKIRCLINGQIKMLRGFEMILNARGATNVI